MRRQLFDLLTLYPRLMGKLALGTLDSGAVLIGLRWRDSRGRTHWKDSLR